LATALHAFSHLRHSAAHACDLGRDENADIAIKAFELSQNLRSKWLTADYSVKRRYLEIVFLNFVLDDVTLVPETRKPFDLLVEGPLVSSSRGDKTPLELFLVGVQAWNPAQCLAAEALVRHFTP